MNRELEDDDRDFVDWFLRMEPGRIDNRALRWDSLPEYEPKPSLKFNVFKALSKIKRRKRRGRSMDKRRTIVFHTVGTGYCPIDDPVEGGPVDVRGVKLTTVQDVVDGVAPHACLAMDRPKAGESEAKEAAFPYGASVRIPEIEQKYGIVIPFRVVDTGGAFIKPGIHRERVDVCVRPGNDPQTGRPYMEDETINGPLTILYFPGLNKGVIPPAGVDADGCGGSYGDGK